MDEGVWKPGKLIAYGDNKCYVPQYNVKNVKDRLKNSDTEISMGYESYQLLYPPEDLNLKWINYLKSMSISVDNIFSSDKNTFSVICRIDYEQALPEDNIKDMSRRRYRRAMHPGILDKDIKHCIFPWDDASGYLDLHGNSDTFEILVINSDE